MLIFGKTECELLFLVFVLFFVSYFDLRFSKIPNQLNLLLLIFAAAIRILFPEGGVEFFLGLLAGLIIYCVPYFLGVLGAGDVKLLAVLGSLLGVEKIFEVAIVAILLGGFVGCVQLAYHGRLLGALVRLRSMVMAVIRRDPGAKNWIDHRSRFPFGPLIVISAIFIVLKYSMV